MSFNANTLYVRDYTAIFPSNCISNSFVLWWLFFFFGFFCGVGEHVYGLIDNSEKPIIFSVSPLRIPFDAALFHAKLDCVISFWAGSWSFITMVWPRLDTLTRTWASDIRKACTRILSCPCPPPTDPSKFSLVANKKGGAHCMGRETSTGNNNNKKVCKL